MFCQIPTTNETVQCSFNVCFPPEGLLPFFCSSSLFSSSGVLQHMLSLTSLVWVNACMCFCLEWVICLCLKWLRHDQKSVIPLVYVQHVWYHSPCTSSPFCMNLSGFFYVKMYHNDVLRTCVACLSLMHIKKAQATRQPTCHLLLNWRRQNVMRLC